MSLILKFCGSCNEGFARGIDRCPNCGSRLEAFRLEAIADDTTRSDPTAIEMPDEIVPSTNYAVTVIAERNDTTRNLLFVGSLAFVVVSLCTGLVVNLFSKDLDLGSIDNGLYNAVLVDDLPEPIDEIPEQKVAGTKGGGGGGDNDPLPASKGDRAPMRTDPQFAPSVSMDRLTNPTIPVQMAIKGPINEKLDTSRYGIKVGGDTPSDGPGSNGGQGSGRNSGQGPGDGPGAGPGSKGGLGDGPDGGIPSNARVDDEEPPGRGRVTTALNITSKPRPGYTDDARLSGVQGNVILRVTFTASGEVGRIDVVKGLPGGLTEKAIAAARRISFIPAMLNGRPQTVTRQIEYGFYIY